MIGVGVGVGFGGVGLSPAWLESQIRTLAGATLNGLWIGCDIKTAGAAVTSWPGRVGPTLAANTTACGVSTVSGRLALTPPDNDAVQVGMTAELASAPKSIIALYQGCAPAVHGRILASFDPATNYGLGVNTGTPGKLYVADATLVTYVNGAASVDFTPGALAVVQADRATNASVNIAVGGYAIYPFGANPGPLLALVTLDAVPAEGLRLSLTSVLRRYGRLS